MGNSLLEQLKKSGLVDKNKAQALKNSQYKSSKQKTKRGAPEKLSEAQLLAQRAQAEKLERDRQLNQQKQEESQRRAIAAQVRQLIETNRVKERDGEIIYNFADANVIKRLYVSAEIHKHLMNGRLAIAKLDEAYELVPSQVADKIKQRDAQCIIQANHATEPQQEGDDPYADYKIPDDLMW